MGEYGRRQDSSMVRHKYVYGGLKDDPNRADGTIQLRSSRWVARWPSRREACGKTYRCHRGSSLCTLTQTQPPQHHEASSTNGSAKPINYPPNTPMLTSPVFIQRACDKQSKQRATSAAARYSSSSSAEFYPASSWPCTTSCKGTVSILVSQPNELAPTLCVQGG